MSRRDTDVAECLSLIVVVWKRTAPNWEAYGKREDRFWAYRRPDGVRTPGARCAA